MSRNPSIRSTALLRVRVGRSASLLGVTGLCPILEQLFPVQFVPDDAVGSKVAGAIILEHTEGRESVWAPDGISSLTARSPASSSNQDATIGCAVTFSDDAEVPFPFRGRVINALMPAETPSLVLRKNEIVLAAGPLGALWAVARSDHAKHFRTALSFPKFSQDKSFADVFNGEHFLEMLPLLHFLHNVTGATVYQTPPLRATFIVDDPNLHWPSYGYVDYRELAARAKTENYHVCFATIPLDAWFTHTPTAELFRRNARWLSLLIHGNDHGKEELAQQYTDATRHALLDQAIQRIERLERKAKLRVCRVMVPPHGACSSDMLADLPESGFEAACISDGSLRAHNRNKPWTRKLGYLPSEVIEGCPVLPRWGLTGNVKNTLLVAAYLGRPLILRGHHQDLKDGPEVFDDLAGFINGLGKVMWANMTELSSRNYLWRMDGTNCHVKPLGTTISFELPGEATALVLDKFDAAKDDDAWRAISEDGCVRQLVLGAPIPVAGASAHRVTIQRVAALRRPRGAADQRLGSVRGVLRRLLTEARDRFLIA